MKRTKLLITATLMLVVMNASAQKSTFPELLLEKKYTELEEQLNRAISSDSAGYEHYYYLGLCKKAQYQFGEAREAFIRARECDSTNPSLLLNLGEIYRLMDQNSKAIETYRQVLEIDSAQTEAWMNLGRIYQVTEQYHKALSIYNELIGNDSSNYYYIKNMAMVYKNLDSIPQAINCYRKALNIAPGNKEFYFQLARLYLSRNAYKLTGIYIGKGLHIDSTYSKLWRVKGLLEYKRKNYQEAKSAYNHTLKYGDSTHTIHKFLGYCSYFTKDFTGAVEHLKEALPYEPENKKVLFYLGMATARTRYLDEAPRYLKMYLAVSLPDSSNLADVYSEMGNIYRARDELENSLKYYSKAFETFPSRKYLLFNMASVLREKKEYEQAIEYYQNYLAQTDTTEATGSVNEKNRRVYLRDMANQSIKRLKKEVFFQQGE